jgi:hypothetical protein
MIDVTSTMLIKIGFLDVTTACGQNKKLIFDEPAQTPPPIPKSPIPFEQREEVNLNFYKILDENDKDPRRAEIRKIVNQYQKPPPIPKRQDSVAKNIDKYFKLDLIKQADKDDFVHQIEREILDFSGSESEDEESDSRILAQVICDLSSFSVKTPTEPITDNLNGTELKLSKARKIGSKFRDLFFMKFLAITRQTDSSIITEKQQRSRCVKKKNSTEKK